MGNIYFDLTEQFNAHRTIAVLTSGQAVVFHRVAIMSKDGDWILEESDAACARVLDVLQGHGACYRPGAPLDVRWLSGGWSSHFEFLDERQRRVRCDFMTRPPRLESDEVRAVLHGSKSAGRLRVIDIEPLIAMKKTRPAKDYAVISELARMLPEEREIELTWEPDRILELTHRCGGRSARQAVRAGREGGGREAVAVALAREANRLQELDRARLEGYARAARAYMAAFHERQISRVPLRQAHELALELAEAHLPSRID